MLENTDSEGDLDTASDIRAIRPSPIKVSIELSCQYVNLNDKKLDD